MIGVHADHVALVLEGGLDDALATRPRTRLLTQYANSFSDPATGKEIAKAEYGQGAGIIFAVAGATGQGVIEAALEHERYMIGVDADQAEIYRASNPRAAEHILGSVMKSVDIAIFRAVQQLAAGQLAFGKAESLGLEENGIRFAGNTALRPPIDDSIKSEIGRLEAAIVAGEIAVPTVFKNASTRSAH
jgi:basic membrane protein A